MENSDIIIKRVEAVAVYLSTDDEIVIRQINSMGDDDGVVVIHPEHIQALVGRLLALKKEASNA